MNDSEVGSFRSVVFKELTQKLELSLNLEKVDVCLRFGINFIRAYRDSVGAQLFKNCVLNTIP